MANHTPMTIRRAFAIIALAAILCGVAGCGVGTLVGYTFPGYYEGLFSRASQRPDFDPVGLGAGLGLTQGLLVGAVVGSVVVAVLTWQYVKLYAHKSA